MAEGLRSAALRRERLWDAVAQTARSALTCLARSRSRGRETLQRLAQIEEQTPMLAEEVSYLRRRLDDHLTDDPGLTALRANVDELARQVATLHAESHAVPFMQGSPFTISHVPNAGAVLGYNGATGQSTPGDAGNDYRAFEDVFRGAEEFIRDRQRQYLPIVTGHEPVLDFGSGRGEFLDLLRDRGIAYMGVDQDPGMVARCHEKGHATVVLADGLTHLAKQPDGSLGAIFSAQVIEHLTVEQLGRMLALARQKLSPDGIFIAETVNPHSPPALKTFWVDLTHQHPIFPEVALELCREAGFPSAFVFHPNGTGDVHIDRFTQGEFAVVAQMTSRA